ncbi:helix-turn-helix transcriptional regulator [Streptomyces marincola]|uniref:helix-turn-helix transcriptional regulator n=1 Tax=Streptomyces marincola TaxID=2878388 RepID=UPI001CF1671E|nr:helix-turn-helix transcriptional regulator [Streptomyces marincola]UCM91831.1 helix-turn-helix transcriptional regulator [Streptomyces marincola]
MYRERASRLGDGAVVWHSRADATSSGRVLPDGCMDLLWRDGELSVAGPDTRAHVWTVTDGQRCTGLRLAPGAGPLVLGVPADQLTDRRVPLGALWGDARARELAERLAAAPRPGEALEALAEERLLRAGPPAGEGAWRRAVVEATGAGRGVAETAWRLGLSERQLRRRSRAAFGYGPKTLARVLRMQRALALAREGTPLVATAALAGYADQAHLAREVRELAGVPISALLAGRVGDPAPRELAAAQEPA